MLYDIDSPLHPKRDPIDIYNEMHRIQEQIEEMQMKLLQLQNQLYRKTGEFNKYTHKGHSKATFQDTFNN